MVRDDYDDFSLESGHATRQFEFYAKNWSRKVLVSYVETQFSPFYSSLKLTVFQKVVRESGKSRERQGKAGKIREKRR